MGEVSFVETTLLTRRAEFHRFGRGYLRDGHASLWAEGMTTGMMLPIASPLDRIGFKSIELVGTSKEKNMETWSYNFL